MKHLFLLLLFFSTTILFAQNKNADISKSTKKERIAKLPDSIATIDMYRVITLQNDTTYIDTSLTIQKEYIFNYLRKDIFGLLPFANEGQTYTRLEYKLDNIDPYPDFGFTAKQFNFLQANDIKYYSVATPLTELYFKTVMQQGQNLDAFITLNTSQRFNFSVAYKGLRSLGRYANQLSSTGNFRFTTNYTTKSGRYFIKAHFTAQDILNQENGGIVNTADFENELPQFQNKARLQVYLNDAETLLKGNRYFFDHGYIIRNGRDNKWTINHQFNFENKSFQFTQRTLATTIVNENEANTTFIRFGNAYTASNINNKTRYNKLYNKLGLNYENSTLGQFSFFAEDFNYNYYYDSVLVLNSVTIPSSISDRINSIGAQYKYQKNKWNGSFLYSNSISNQSLTNLDAHIQYSFNDENQVSFTYQKANKLPNNIFTLYQSSYVNYNWYRPDFKNEKYNTISINANTQWLNAQLEYGTINDKLYFANSNTEDQNILLVSPQQYGQTINYLSLKLAKEITFGKFALDNTVLYQNVRQNNDILNLPEVVTRNTFYFSDYLFKRAMYIQTGFIFNYFSAYTADNYNPLIGEFYVQTDKKIGAFPMIDFFINARIRQTRIYLKAEHFNSSFTGNNYFSAPNYPYRDFTIRFGLVWNFFQ